MPRLQALQAYWRKYPPVHVLVAGFVGYKAPAQQLAEVASHPNIAMLKARFPDGVMRG